MRRPRPDRPEPGTPALARSPPSDAAARRADRRHRPRGRALPPARRRASGPAHRDRHACERCLGRRQLRARRARHRPGPRPADARPRLRLPPRRAARRACRRDAVGGGGGGPGAQTLHGRAASRRRAPAVRLGDEESALRVLSLALKFAVELAAFTAFGYWGAHVGGGATSVFLAIAAPALAIVLWALLAAPRSTRRLPRSARVPFELGVFVLAVAALFAAGASTAAAVLALLVATSTALLFRFEQWEA